MVKLRVYIVQFLGILLLLCAYFIDAKEDRTYDMHFNTDSSSSYVIKKPTTTPFADLNHSYTASISSKDNSQHKFNIGKDISFELVLPHGLNSISFITADLTTYTSPLPERYEYLFFREINPPPPKNC